MGVLCALHSAVRKGGAPGGLLLHTTLRSCSTAPTRTQHGVAGSCFETNGRFVGVVAVPFDQAQHETPAAMTRHAGTGVKWALHTIPTCRMAVEVQCGRPMPVACC